MPPAMPSFSEPVQTIGQFPIYENSVRTDGLAGATFVQTSHVHYEGRKALMFVFSVSGILYLFLPNFAVLCSSCGDHTERLT